MSLPAGLRTRLAAVADGLIPEADGMPAPSSVGIAGAQLDVVLASRPDLEPGVRRALEAAEAIGDAVAWIEALHASDPAAYEALVTAIVAGYYMHPDVQRRLGYPGQTSEQVRTDGYAEYVDELERVYARGPIYRPTPTR